MIPDKLDGSHTRIWSFGDFFALADSWLSLPVSDCVFDHFEHHSPYWKNLGMISGASIRPSR